MDRQQDARRFSECITTLEKYFDKPLEEKLKLLYFGSLQDLSIEEMERATHQAIAQLKWFPKIAELRELAEGTKEDQAAIAWTIAVEAHRKCGDTHSVAFEDGFIGAALKTVFGGWLEFCTAMHQVWGTADVNYEERQAARLERREPEGRHYLISGLSDEMVASKRKEFIVAYRAAKRTGQKIHYFAGQCEVNNRLSAGSWMRGELGESYTQPVYLARASGGVIVEASFDRLTGGLIGGVDRLLEAPKPTKRLAPPAQKYLPPAPDDLPTIEESQAAYKEGFQRMMKRMKMPEPRRTMTPEETQARAKELLDQLKLIDKEQSGAASASD